MAIKIKPVVALLNEDSQVPRQARSLKLADDVPVSTGHIGAIDDDAVGSICGPRGVPHMSATRSSDLVPFWQRPVEEIEDETCAIEITAIGLPASA